MRFVQQHYMYTHELPTVCIIYILYTKTVIHKKTIERIGMFQIVSKDLEVRVMNKKFPNQEKQLWE